MAASISSHFDRPAWLLRADYLATAVAISLPWSSSVTSITVALWLVALLPTLQWEDVRRAILTPSGALPIALVVFGAVGMIWADVTLIERWNGFSSFLRLLVIPLLLVQFRHSEHWRWPLVGFLSSAVVLLGASFVSAFFSEFFWGYGKTYGIVVKDQIAQSAEFSLAAFGTFFMALRSARANRIAVAIAWTLLGCAFLANIIYVTTSRTTLVTIPVLTVLFLFQFAGRTRIAMVALGVALIAAAWSASPMVRQRLGSLSSELEQFRTLGLRTSAGDRMDFLSKGMVIVRDAPLIGHGTGSIKEMYQRAAVDKTGSTAEVTDNPHNQTLAVAIQLGLAGALVLWAMWFAHLVMFLRGNGLIAFVGATIVLQNMIGSLFNSHLFDFTHGWIYVWGVGCVGGAMLARAREDAASVPSKRS